MCYNSAAFMANLKEELKDHGHPKADTQHGEDNLPISPRYSLVKSIDKFFDEIADQGSREISENDFAFLGQVAADATIACEESALRALANGLQYGLARRTHGEVEGEPATSQEQRKRERIVYERGRLNGQLDVVAASVYRIPNLDPADARAQLLEHIATNPGQSSADATLAEHLSTQESNIKRRKLALATMGLVHQPKRGDGSWVVTPRGDKALDSLIQERQVHPQQRKVQG